MLDIIYEKLIFIFFLFLEKNKMDKRCFTFKFGPQKDRGIWPVIREDIIMCLTEDNKKIDISHKVLRSQYIDGKDMDPMYEMELYTSFCSKKEALRLCKTDKQCGYLLSLFKKVDFHCDERC